MKRSGRRPVTAGFVVVVLLAGLFSLSCDPQLPTAPGPLASIAVSAQAILAIKATQQFRAEGRDATGAAVAISPTWSISGGGGTISVEGLFTAGTLPGTYKSTVMASSDGISGRASVTVTNGAVVTTN